MARRAVGVLTLLGLLLTSRAAHACAPPSIRCGDPITAIADAGKCSASGLNPTPPPGSNSDCGTAAVTGKRSDGLPLTDPYPIGTTTITWTATDIAGRQATCEQTVTVSGGSPPTISAPADLSVSTDAGQCTASNVSLGTPTTSGGCGATSVTNDAPTTFPLGKTTVTWTVIDGQGNQATGQQTVTVSDMELPTLTCPPSKVVSADAGGCSASVPVDQPTVTDNCAGVTAASSRSDGKVLDAPYPAGTTALTWTATDAAGNTATCTQTVTVKYDWSGVLQPINADGSSVFKAGSTVPVKFSLGCSGSLAATLAYTKVDSSVAGGVNEAVSPGTATSGNLFRYDATSGQYIYNWSTKGLSAGTYQLQINLGDGVTRTVTVGLR